MVGFNKNRTGWGRFILNLVIVIITSVSADCQLHCINYTSQDGLPTDDVICAASDHDGFMWFGTGSGVCKFDGIQFKNVSSLGTGHIPGGVFTQAIAIDENNDLWIGTDGQGIYHFDTQRKHWTNYSTDISSTTLIPADKIFFIHSNQDGKIWYGGTNAGLGCINIHSKKNQNFSVEHLPMIGGWKNKLNNLLVDNNDPTYFYLIGQGYLYKFNTNNNTFSVPPINQKPELIDRHSFSPQTMVYGPNHEIWMGTWSNGLKSYDIQNGSYENITLNNSKDESTWRMNIFPGKGDELWLSDKQNGISHFQNNNWISYQSEAFNRNSLLPGPYNQVFCSPNNETWVLTDNGISLIVSQFQSFEYYETNVENINFFQAIKPIKNTQNYIASFAGQNAPLKILDADFSVVSTQYIFPSRNSFQAIFQIYPYHDKFICLADKLFIYDPISNEFSPYDILNNQIKSSVRDLLIDGHSNIWLVLENNTILKYSTEKNTSEEYFIKGHEGQTRDKINYHDIEFVGENLWITASTELIVFDTSNILFQYFYSDGSTFKERTANAPLNLRTGTIEQILPTQDNQALMLTSAEGLYLLEYTADSTLNIVKTINKQDLDQLQTPVEIVNGMGNDYWIATKNGLVHADHNFKTFSLYRQREGLKSNKLSQGIERIGGQLFIGMPKGFAKADIENLQAGRNTSTCFITSASIDTFVLSASTKNIFKHTQNSLSVSLATPNYHTSKSVLYAHRLINKTKDWSYSKYNETNFQYDHLQPDKYRFEAKVKSDGTEWSEVKGINFTIKAPFWNTLWFKLLTFCFVIGILYWAYKFRIKRVVKNVEIKTKMAELESQAIRAQMNPHFIFNSLNSIKSLILLDRKKEGITYLTKFSKMVREILNISTYKTIPLARELELLKIYLDMESLRFHQKFEYKIEIDPSVNIYKLMVPPLLIQPFAENSIWHGLMHKEGDAKLFIRLNIIHHNLIILIEDNGIGRKASDQIKSKKSIYNKTSKGIKLSKNRIKLADENADVDITDIEKNNIVEGTLVTIKLPIDYGK